MTEKDSSAGQLVAEHKDGRCQVHDTVGTALDCAERLQPSFNAFAAIDREGAESAARAIEQKLAAGEEAGSLAGVPVSVKDILDVAGLPTRWGSHLFASAAPAKSDVAAVGRLRQADAVIIGKTTTTEFAHSPLARSPLTGLTRNPWAPELTCGGSSAGAGVSVATGITPIALATDAGCSTRLPAACTGVYGLKPTLGRIPHDRVPDAFGTFIHLGILARAIEDISLALGVVAGPHPADPSSLRGAFAGTDEGDEAVAGKRVLVWLKTGNSRVAEEVRTSVSRAADLLREQGAEVVEADYDLPHPDPIWRVLQQSNWASRFAASRPEDRVKLEATLNAGIDEALGYSALDLSRAQGKRTELFRGVQARFGSGFDLILTPCVSAPPVAAEFDLLEPLVVDGEEAGDLRAEWTAYLSLFDLTGHPALSVPVGFAENGGPLGVQLVAPWWRESALFGAAQALASLAPPFWRER